ncbi:hypothetical protein EZV62_003397 [Acer yangbiense]|uniref:Uncharacterized protein n=1 Tax=Acer yangbiense TaxID=1000413 RepID=A0A5C7IIH2_9ROSI|nr:hypothetical protein EZV62_003397 [Acer yangbiense]
MHNAARASQWNFIRQLVECVSTPQSVAVRNSHGSTVLHIVAQGGNLKTSMALIQKNPDLIQMVDNKGKLPLFFAIYRKNKKLAWYLSLKNIADSDSNQSGFIPSLPGILHNLIQSGYCDIALYFVRRFPQLALAKDEDGNSLLKWMCLDGSRDYS